MTVTSSLYAVAISKMDVLMEDYTNIFELIKTIVADTQKLFTSRNTWEVFFEGYVDDPREIPDIPEVVNWFKKSIEAGIPWFYFMNTTKPAIGLLTFITCCSAERDSDYSKRYYFEPEKINLFVKKNLDNLANFVKVYDIPNEIGIAATDKILEIIKDLLQGTANEEQQTEHAMTIEKKKKEALYRLSTLEQLYGLNPKVQKYFEDERLYYSYLTCGGFMGSIDTIDYDKRYSAIVKAFEEQTASLVYHVIEHGNTLAILFVSNDYTQWSDERPTEAGISALIFNVKTHEQEYGYIKVDNNNGALYRINDIVYTSITDKDKMVNGLTDIDCEIVERLEILKNTGIVTDLDITALYLREDEICYSSLQTVLGNSVAVIDRISKNTGFSRLLSLLSKQTSKKFYFLMGSANEELAFLYLSEDSSDWEMEKFALEKRSPFAIVVNLNEMTAEERMIKFKIVKGGPLFYRD